MTKDTYQNWIFYKVFTYFNTNLFLLQQYPKDWNNKIAKKVINYYNLNILQERTKFLMNTYNAKSERINLSAMKISASLLKLESNSLKPLYKELDLLTEKYLNSQDSKELDIISN